MCADALPSLKEQLAARKSQVHAEEGEEARVEAVARAIWKATSALNRESDWYMVGPKSQDRYRVLARAAVAAYEEARKKLAGEATASPSAVTSGSGGEPGPGTDENVCSRCGDVLMPRWNGGRLELDCRTCADSAVIEDGARSRACRAEVPTMLNEMPFVKWDRLINNGNISVYGWIPRPDGKFDFVLVEWMDPGKWTFATSSAEFDARIADVLGIGSDNRFPCQRVADVFPGVGWTTSQTHDVGEAEVSNPSTTVSCSPVEGEGRDGRVSSPEEGDEG